MDSRAEESGVPSFSVGRAESVSPCGCQAESLRNRSLAEAIQTQQSSHMWLSSRGKSWVESHSADTSRWLRRMVKKPGMVVHAYNPSTWEAGVGKSRVPGHLRLQSEFEAKLWYMRVLFQKAKTNQKQKVLKRVVGKAWISPDLSKRWKYANTHSIMFSWLRYHRHRKWPS